MYQYSTQIRSRTAEQICKGGELIKVIYTRPSLGQLGETFPPSKPVMFPNYAEQ